MNSKHDNIEIIINEEANEVIEKPLKSLKNRYQNNLEAMSINEFAIDYVHLLYYKCHEINSNLGEWYVDYPDSIKIKKATIKPINKKDNKCFQYAATIALNHEQIEKHPERIAKIKPFINKYIWEKINFPSEKDDWEKIEKNNITIDLNVLYAKKEKIDPAYGIIMRNNVQASRWFV